MTKTPLIPYEEIGAEKLSELIDIFYSKVAEHPDLHPIFPNDLTETARKQIQFQTQFLGGPNLFSEEHGHPMMKARHMPFSITPKRAKAWLSCMHLAMNEVDLDEKIRTMYYKRLEMTAMHMVNKEDD